MDLRFIFLGLEVEAGLALLEARAARINPKAATGFVDRCIWRARAAARAAAESMYTIVPNHG